MTNSSSHDGDHDHRHSHEPGHGDGHDQQTRFEGGRDPDRRGHDHGDVGDHGGHGDHDHDDHDHDHSHGAGGHHHHHHHGPTTGHGRAFAIAVALNLTIVVVQVVFGLIAHSAALLADAGHNLSDVLGLLLAWGATWLATRRPSARFTFGFGSTSILASLVNAALLLFASGAIVAESIRRLLNPAPVAGFDVFVVASIGIVVNGFSAWLFMRGNKDDLNIRGAFLHMAADAAISAAVAVSGLVILGTGWSWIDPVMSFVVVAVVVYGTWGLLRDATHMALAAVPPGVDTKRIHAYLAGLPGVADVHDLHVWALSTTESALTAHLVMPGGHPGDTALDGVVRTLRDRYAMHHATLQVDLGTSDHHCSLDREDHAH
jgi:cobalt-zinc-cadmium efflux system protein